MNIATISDRTIAQSNSYEVKINSDELTTQVIQSPTLLGLYLGWLRKDTQKWEPLVKLMVVEGGYTAEYTSNHEEISALYPGYKDLLLRIEKNVVKQNFPHIFDSRMPLLRKDVKSYCEFLKLDYPQIDKIAYASRCGGRISGDPFNICPIIEPDAKGNYIFYCTLSEVEEIEWNRENWQEITNQTEGFNLVEVSGKYSLQLQDRVIGYLEDYFNLIDGEITTIEIVNFTDMAKWQGRGILLKIVVHSNNAYSQELFQIA
jgi:hypothetical protein